MKSSHARIHSTNYLIILALLSFGCDGAHLQSPKTIGEASVRTGSLDPEVIKTQIRSSRPTFKRCYTERLKQHPHLAGTIKVSFTIQPSGQVTGAQVVQPGTTITETTFQECLCDAVSKLTFPKPTGEGVVKVTYPFQFKPSKTEATETNKLADTRLGNLDGFRTAMQSGKGVQDNWKARSTVGRAGAQGTSNVVKKPETGSSIPEQVVAQPGFRQTAKAQLAETHKADTNKVEQKSVRMGSLDPEVIKTQVRASRPEIQRCYNKGLKRKPTLAGTIKITFTIQPSGQVTGAKVAQSGTTISETTFQECLRDIVSKLTFPKPNGDGMVKVTYPFRFKPN